MCSLSPGTLSCSSPFLQTVLCAQNQTHFSNCMSKETDQSRTVLFWEYILRVKSTHWILLTLVPVSQLIILGKFFKNRDSKSHLHGVKGGKYWCFISGMDWPIGPKTSELIWEFRSKCGLCGSRDSLLFEAFSFVVLLKKSDSSQLPSPSNFSTPLKLPDWSGQK